MNFYGHRQDQLADLPLFSRRARVADSTVTPGEAGRASLPGAARISEGLRRKREGRERIEARAPELATILRAEARRISADRGWVTIDDVRVFAERLGLASPHKNFWGCIFAGSGWEKVGEAPSGRPTNHGHRNPRWRWRTGDG